jgi:hypothetical protein
LDTSLLVVEVKSGKVTDPAKRGGELRIQSEVADLLVDPAEQSQRFAQFLLENRAVHRFPTRTGTVSEVDTRHALVALPLTVTLDGLTAIAASNASLEKAGFVPKGVELNLALTLADLEIVLDLLPTPAQRLHYLRRRNDLERRLEFVGDEVDILALYTDTGFDLGPMEEEPSRVMIPALSGDIDRHYMNPHVRKKPARRFTNSWLRLLTTLEQRGFEGWSEVSFVLLHASYDTQRRVTSLLKRTTQAVGARRVPTQFVIGTVGPPQDLMGLAFLVFRDLSRDERNRMGDQGLGRALQQDGVRRALLIGCDTTTSPEPYAFLAVGPPGEFERVTPPPPDS